MSFQKINLLNTYLNHEDLNYKQVATRRETLKEITNNLNNSYFTLKNSEVNNHQFLNLTSENSKWLAEQYNNELLPDIDWDYSILKNGYIIEGKFNEYYTFGFYFNTNDKKFFIGRNCTFNVIDKYSYPFRKFFINQLCNEFNLSFFDSRNSILISDIQPSDNFFEDINNQLIDQLRRYSEKFQIIENYIVNNQNSKLLNWFDLDGNVFATPQEFNYQGYFFGSDIENISEFNRKYFNLYEETLDQDLLLFIVHKNIPLARSFVTRSDFIEEENILLTKKIIEAFITAFKRYKNDGNATIATYSNFWLLQAYSRTLSIIVRERCDKLFGVKPTFAEVDEYRRNLKEELGQHAPIGDLISSLQPLLEKKIDKKNEKVLQNKIDNFNSSGPVKFFESIGIKTDFKKQEKIISDAILVLKISRLILEDRELEIIHKRYFPNEVIDFKHKVTSLETVGEEYGLTRERIRQLEEIAKNKIQVFISMKNLDDFKEEFILQYGQNIIPEDRNLRTGLRKLFKYLNTQHIYFTGQLKDLGENWLVNKLTNLGIESYISDSYRNYIFGSFEVSNPLADSTLLTQSIDILELSFRAHNSLLNNGIYNIKLLKDKSLYDLRNIKNLGETSAQEIHFKLNKLLKPQEEDSNQSVNTESRIIDLNFSLRIQNALNAENITTLDQLLSLTEEDLYNITNLGITSIREILKKINELGLTLNR